MKDNLHAVITIVEYTLRDKMMDLFMKENIPVLGVTHGHGLAENEILDLLGIAETRKAIFISVSTTAQIQRLIHGLNDDFDIKKHGKGISFTVPLSSASGFLDRFIHSCDVKNNFDKGEKTMNAGYPYELIITIVQKGFAETVKSSATKAGARSGTLLHALGLGGTESSKFLGIHIQPEKDFILLVVEKEHKQPVMKAILDSCGIATEGRGICFSLPVSEAIGLSTDLSEQL